MTPSTSYTSPSISDHVLSSYTALQASIAHLQHVPDALAHQAQRVKDLQRELLETKENVGKYAEVTKKAREMRNSTTRRLAHRLTRRTELADKEER